MEFHNGTAHLVVTLQDQCPDMFDLFCYWINERRDFHYFIDEAEGDGSCKDLHWDLINLHLFAAQLQIPELQDLAMDAIQDLYLRCNWDIKPELIRYVYQECDPRDSCRLRKWIVASKRTLQPLAFPCKMFILTVPSSDHLGARRLAEGVRGGPSQRAV